MALVIDPTGKVLGTTESLDSGSGNRTGHAENAGAPSRMSRPGAALALLPERAPSLVKPGMQDKMTVISGSVVPPGGVRAYAVAFAEPMLPVPRQTGDAARFGQGRLPDRAGQPRLAPYRLLQRPVEGDPVSDTREAVREVAKMNKDMIDTTVLMQAMQHMNRMAELEAESIRQAGRNIENAARRD